jgi:hypothetical protein
MLGETPSTALASLDVTGLPGNLNGHATLYLVLAVACLVIALRFVKRALEPIQALMHVVAAAAVVAFTVGAALALVAAAALTAR